MENRSLLSFRRIGFAGTGLLRGMRSKSGTTGRSASDQRKPEASGTSSSATDLRKRDGSVNITRAGRFYTSFYLDQFYETHRELLMTLDALANPLKLFVLYEDFVRGLVLEANPGLREERPGGGEFVHEARIGALVRRILPEFPQFIAAWLDRFEMPPFQTPAVRRKGFVKGRRIEEDTGLR